MSILIKGMEMPKKGEYKPLFIYDTGEVTMEICGEEVQVATAVPVPPHGRLIDADALERDGFHTAVAYTAKMPYEYTPMLISSAPTIIPATAKEDA